LLPRLVMAFAALFPLVVPVGSPPSAPLPNLLPRPPDHFNAKTQHVFFCMRTFSRLSKKILPRLVVALAALFPLVVPVGSWVSTHCSTAKPAPTHPFYANARIHYRFHAQDSSVENQPKPWSKHWWWQQQHCFPWGCQFGICPMLHCQTRSHTPCHFKSQNST